MKLCLGTVQFGLDYGINNKRGEIPLREVFDIINCAYKNNIKTLDTAYDYGKSENKIGLYNLKYPRNQLRIISKIPQGKIGLIKKNFSQSLERLNQTHIYGLLIHNFNPRNINQKLYEFLNQLKTKKIVSKIGVSINNLSDLKPILQEKFPINIVQLPYNLFDQRFEQFFPILNKKKIDIYSRSAFLQGLVFKEPEILDAQFVAIKQKLLLLHAFAKKHNTTVLSMCLNFCLSSPYIKKVVIGVDNQKNLKEIITSVKQLQKIDFAPIKKSLKENNLNIIKPSLWKK